MAAGPLTLDPSIVTNIAGVRSVLRSGRTITALAVSPGFQTDRIVFAGTGLDGVFRSTDGGETWEQINDGLTNPLVVSLAISPAFETDRTLFAGTTFVPFGRQSGALYRTTDAGDTWELVAVGSGGANPPLFSPAFESDHMMFATDESGWSRSIDGGDTWQQIAASATWRLAISPDFSRDSTLLGFHWQSGDVFRSIDGGDTWQQIREVTSSNETAPWFRGTSSVALSPAFDSDSTVFGTNGSSVLTGGDEVFRSTDGGESWQAVSEGLPLRARWHLALSPAFERDNTLFVAADETFAFDSPGVFRSTDRGETWQPVLTNRGILSFAVSPAFETDATLFAGANNDTRADEVCDAWGGGVFRSTDGGANWERFLLPPPPITLLQALRPPCFS